MVEKNPITNQKIIDELVKLRKCEVAVNDKRKGIETWPNASKQMLNFFKCVDYVWANCNDVDHFVLTRKVGESKQYDIVVSHGVLYLDFSNTSGYVYFTKAGLFYGYSRYNANIGGTGMFYDISYVEDAVNDNVFIDFIVNWRNEIKPLLIKAESEYTAIKSDNFEP